VAAQPKNIIFLTADAFGVLPPVSKLTKQQAIYHFLSGYTSKLAGTEQGVTAPIATFSMCFGEPFMPLNPFVYAELFAQKLTDNTVDVWLINTGWSGGPYGVGNRMPLPVTRKIVDACIDGSLAQSEFFTEPYFGFHVPKKIEGIQPNILYPESMWEDKEAYAKQANALLLKFHENFAKFSLPDCAEWMGGAPRAVR
ncbi:MAG: phosphoenolpyruvate carboxykinase (ATP), partial [Bacilli bacterium]